MVTKLFKNLLKHLIWNSKYNYRYYGDEFKNVQGQTRYIKSVQGMPFGSAFSTSNSTEGIHIGYGTTPPTENDYTLESPITSGVSGVVAVQSNNNSENPDKLHFIVTVRNTSSSSITISEIGYYVQYNASTSQNTGSSTASVFLIDRTLLSTPVTIPAGESALINYEIDPIDSE